MTALLKWVMTLAAGYAWWRTYDQWIARSDWRALEEDQFLRLLGSQLQSCQEDLNKIRNSSATIRGTFDAITQGLVSLTGGNPKARALTRQAVQNYLSAINIEGDTLPPVCKTAIDKAEALGIEVPQL